MNQNIHRIATKNPQARAHDIQRQALQDVAMHNMSDDELGCVDIDDGEFRSVTLSCNLGESEVDALLTSLPAAIPLKGVIAEHLSEDESNGVHSSTESGAAEGTESDYDIKTKCGNKSYRSRKTKYPKHRNRYNYKIPIDSEEERETRFAEQSINWSSSKTTCSQGKKRVTKTECDSSMHSLCDSDSDDASDLNSLS